MGNTLSKMGDVTEVVADDLSPGASPTALCIPRNPDSMNLNSFWTHSWSLNGRMFGRDFEFDCFTGIVHLKNGDMMMMGGVNE